MSIGFGFERLGLLTLKYPRIIGAFLIAITAVCVYYLPQARVDADILRVYRNSGEMYQRYQDLGAAFGTFENDSYILAHSDDLTDPEVLESLRNLAFDLELSPFAVGTLSPFSLRKPAANGVTQPAVPENMQTREEVAAALHGLRENDPIMRNLITEGLDGLVMIMFPDPSTTSGPGEKAMLIELRALVADYSNDKVTVELTGPPVWKAEMLDASISDEIKFSIVGFIIGAAMSLICLRSFWGAVLATITPVVSVMWVVGIVTIMFGAFSFLTNVVVVLALVIAFAESMYFCFTWLRLWRDGMDPEEAIGETVLRVTPAAALTTITTVVSFTTLVITQGQGIAEFGISGAIAVIITFVTLVTFMPLAFKLAIRLGFKPPQKLSIAVSAPIPLAQWATRNWTKPIAVVAVLSLFVLIPVHFSMSPRFNFHDFLPKDSAALDTAAGIDEGVGGVAPIYIRVPLDQGLENVGDKDFEKLKKVHEILEANVGKGKVISGASFTHYSDSGFSREQIFNAVGPFLKRRFVTDDNSQALVTGFLPTVLSSDNVKSIVEKTDADLVAAGIEGAEVSGLNVLTSYASTEMIGSMRNGLSIAIVVNIFIIGFAFRSWRVALVSIIPNVLPILGTELYLFVSGAGLQFTTMIALTIAFGIAVDDTIHFLATYMRNKQSGRSHEESVYLSLERIGPALVATTLILCAGTFVVIFSALPQIALFGTLTVLTFMLALLGDLFILPSLLLAGGRFFAVLGGTKK